MQYAQYIAVSICTACVYVMRYDCIEYKSCHQADYENGKYNDFRPLFAYKKNT